MRTNYRGSICLPMIVFIDQGRRSGVFKTSRYRLRPTTNHALQRMGDQRMDIVSFMVLLAPYEKSKFSVSGRKCGRKAET